MLRSGDFKGFIEATITGDLEAVRYYLSIGIDPNHLHPEIMTNPLIEAVRTNNLEITKVLLAAGGDPFLISQIGESPIKLARTAENRALLGLLKEHQPSYFSRFISFMKKPFN